MKFYLTPLQQCSSEILALMGIHGIKN